MNRFQKIDFITIDDFLEYLPKNELELVKVLRTFILENIPNCIEKLAYNVPFYYWHSRICFIWPSSVPWGNVKLNGVQLGFCNGYLLNDNFNWLEKGNRKQVYSKTFSNINDINFELLKIYLYDAIEIDKNLKNKR
jgi:hypothetical protein